MILIIAATVIFSGCTQQVKNSGAIVMPNILYVSPIVLFEGEGERFKPFLGPLSGGAKLKYMGDKKEAKIYIEVWEKGIKQETLDITKFSIWNTQTEKGEIDGELITSVKKVNDGSINPEYEITMALVQKFEESIVNHVIYSFKTHTAFSPIHLSEKNQVSDDEEIAVWGFQESDELNPSIFNSFDKNIQQATWCMVIKVSLEE